jgi:3-deoxy-7-phosphoheptulonate synthase
MVESSLKGGRQEIVPGRPLVYGQSVTDACISWEDSVPVLDGLAGAVRARRQRLTRAVSGAGAIEGAAR